MEDEAEIFNHNSSIRINIVIVSYCIISGSCQTYLMRSLFFYVSSGRETDIRHARSIKQDFIKGDIKFRGSSTGLKVGNDEA